MAKDPATKPPRGSKGAAAAAGKKGAKAKKAKGPRFEKSKQIVAAYKITYQRDRTLPLWMALAFFGAFAVALLVITLLGVPIYFGAVTAVLFGVLALMIVFG